MASADTAEVVVTSESIEVGEHDGEPERVSLSVKRVGDPRQELTRSPSQCDLWAYVWAAGAVAADLALTACGSQRELRVLEVGSGLGLPSLVAARAGARAVVATDLVQDALTLLEENARASGIPDGILSTARLDWFAVQAREKLVDPANPSAVLEEPFDLLIGADVLYLSSCIRPVLATAVASLARPHGVCVLVDAARVIIDDVLDMATSMGLGCWARSLPRLPTDITTIPMCNIYIIWTGEEIPRPDAWDSTKPGGQGGLPPASHALANALIKAVDIGLSRRCGSRSDVPVATCLPQS